MLESYAICDTEEVWQYLDSPDKRRTEFEEQMEGWVNAASLFLEGMLNRKIMARTFDTYQNGTGRGTIVLAHYPVLDIKTLEISGVLLDTTTSISPLRSDRQVVFDPESGLVKLIGLGFPGEFTRGMQNIHIVYDAGFTGTNLYPFKEGVKELISVFWNAMGNDPRAQQSNDSIGASFFRGNFSPKTVPFVVQRLMDIYGVREV